MKVLIIYFSQTGNTEKVAKAIQTGIKQITGHCNILKLKEASPRRLYEYDLLGIGSPIFHWVAAPNVIAFVNNMRFLGGKHVFAFCTHATTWYFKESIVPRLKRRGLVVIGTGDWYGHSNGPLHFPTPYFTDGHPDELDLQEAEDFGREMVERSLRISAGETNLIPPDPDKFSLPDFVHSDFADTFKWKKMARLNMARCLYPACRLCMDNCPLDGIDLTVDPPIFAQPCTDCHFCEQICPTGAIEIDYDRLEACHRLATKRVKEIFSQRVLEAQAQGRFRMLVSQEDIGWDTPLYKVYTKSPRWIIGKGRQERPTLGDS